MKSVPQLSLDFDTPTIDEKRLAEKRHRRNEYMKRWYASNKDHVKDWRKTKVDILRIAREKRYRENAKREIEYQSQYYEANRATIIAKAAQKRAENKDISLLRDAEYRRRHPERILENAAKWKRENPDKVNAQIQRRKAKVRGNSGEYTVEEWQELKARYNYTCLMCRKQEPEIKLTIDHVIPISKGGSNDISNIQCLCGPCNSSKSDKILDLR